MSARETDKIERSRPPRVYAIGDVHGCAQELRALIAQLPIDSEATVVFLGDYVDRGPDSKGVVDQILALSRHCQVVALKGNHEGLFLEFLDRPESAGAALFILNGGATTLASYDDGAGGYRVPPEHAQFYRDLKLSWETDRHFFVHAGVPERPLAALNASEDEETLTWVREPFLSSDYRWEKTIVHGHTPVRQAEVRSNRVNLDTGCVFGGRLTALEVNSMKFFAVARDADFAGDEGADSRAGNRRSERFRGFAPVFVARVGGEALEFETLNYNEHGLLIQEKDQASELLAVGNSINGWIGERRAIGAKRIDFEGEVVRTENRGDLALYGIRLTRLDRDGDSIK